MARKCLPNPLSSLHSHPYWWRADLPPPSPSLLKIIASKLVSFAPVSLSLVHSPQFTYGFQKLRSDHSTCRLLNLQWFPSMCKINANSLEKHSSSSTINLTLSHCFNCFFFVTPSLHTADGGRMTPDFDSGSTCYALSCFCPCLWCPLSRECHFLYSQPPSNPV